MEIKKVIPLAEYQMTEISESTEYSESKYSNNKLAKQLRNTDAYETSSQKQVEIEQAKSRIEKEKQAAMMNFSATAGLAVVGGVATSWTGVGAPSGGAASGALMGASIAAAAATVGASASAAASTEDSKETKSENSEPKNTEDALLKMKLQRILA